MSEWSGVCGTHWGLIGERCALLIERALAPETLHAVSTQHTVEGILDTLVSRGIEQLPGFCLVGFDDSRVTAYLRGGFSLRVEASWHDALTESGQNMRTWREVSVDGVSRFAMLGPDEWHRAEVPVRSYAPDRERIVPGMQGLALAVCEQLSSGEVPLMTTTHGTERTRERSAPVDTASAGSIFDELFGGGEPQFSGAELDDDGSTNTEPDDSTVRAAATPAGALTETRQVESTPETGDTRRREIILPGGDVVRVTGPTLLGRNPRAAEDEDAELVAVFDPNGNVSRTHLRVFPTDDGVLVEDLGSTNGTILVTETDETSLPPHAPRLMRTGDRIILGGDAQLEFRERE